jgi:phage portal protein BeeE
MGLIKSAIDYSSDLYRYAITKYRTPAKAPPYIAAEIDEYPTWDRVWYNMDEAEHRQAAMRISWIYSNVNRIASEVSSARFDMFAKGSNEKDVEHPLEEIMTAPNDFFDGTSLLRYTIWGLMLSQWGSHWFIMPDANGNVKELWPFPVGRIKPAKDKNKFIGHYDYTPKGYQKPIKIRREYVCRFFFSHPEDLWKSLTPLSAAGLSISLYDAVSTSVRDTFKQGRGVPLSVLSVSPSVSDPDFIVVQQRLREDWEAERRIAIVRGGDLDVKTVGISNSDLEVSTIRDMNKDEIDSIFMGFPWRSARLISGEGLKEVNRQIKESTIYPLHKMIAGQIQIGIINPFYGKKYAGRFEDVRAQDRSVSIQERTIYWSAYTFNEARADLGLPPVSKLDTMPELGELPLRLATNASFMLKYYGLGEIRDPLENPEEIGNLPLSQDQEQTTNEIAEGDVEEGEESTISMKAALEEGMRADLKRYRTVLTRLWKSTESTDALMERAFETQVVPQTLIEEIRAKLCFVNSEDDIKAIFTRVME